MNAGANVSRPIAGQIMIKVGRWCGTDRTGIMSTALDGSQDCGNKSRSGRRLVPKGLGRKIAVLVGRLALHSATKYIAKGVAHAHR